MIKKKKKKEKKTVVEEERVSFLNLTLQKDRNVQQNMLKGETQSTIEGASLLSDSSDVYSHLHTSPLPDISLHSS